MGVGILVVGAVCFYYLFGLLETPLVFVVIPLLLVLAPIAFVVSAGWRRKGCGLGDPRLTMPFRTVMSRSRVLMNLLLLLLTGILVVAVIESKLGAAFFGTVMDYLYQHLH